MLEKHYSDSIGLEESTLSKLHRSSKILLWAKLFSFGFAVYAFYQYVFENLNAMWGLVSFVFLGLYLLIMFIDSKLQKNINLHIQIKITLENEIKYLNRDFSVFDDGSEFVDAKHSYSYDLDLFGKDSLFNRINRTVSKLGRIKLANYLQNLELSVTKIKERQESIRELAQQMNWRILFLSFGIDANYDLSKLAESLQTESIKSSLVSKGMRLVMLLSSISTIGLIIASIYDLVPVSFPSTLFLIQLLICITLSGKVTKAANEVSGLLKGFKPYRELIKHVIDIKFQGAELQSLQSKLRLDNSVDVTKAFTELSAILNKFDQRANLLTYVIFNGLFMNDLWTLSKYLVWKKKNAPFMPAWVNVLGEFDALVSLGTYAYNNPQNCDVELLEGELPVLSTKDVYHPFISKEVVVRNDFSLDQKTFAIITGANMAGKSTFLRSIGVNFIMALNGLPVCAKSFQVTPMNLFSSMRTSDNLVKNISYFNAELIRLEDLIMSCKSNKHTLIILDEILKGTNSIDKLKGSKLLLQEISKLPVSGIIATHDLDLTKLSEGSEKYFNYCFEIELAEEIKYTYRMEKGVAKNLNATYLLQKIIDKIN